MTVLVTGVAGFIGFHVAAALLARGESVVGVDNVNEYYDVALKEARLAQLDGAKKFSFVRADICDRDAMDAAMAAAAPMRRIVHLAAQAGVRYSLDHPFAYTESNVTGHLSMLEACRHADGIEHMVYASSSSVYGGNTKLPFSVDDRTDRPLSLYAATKSAAEQMSRSYAHLYRLPLTGLRFFTVYGPWGRPDMALFIFTKAILEGRPIRVFNRGDMGRDFTYIDDIVKGTLAALDHPPADDGVEPPHRVFNLGNHHTEPLLRLVELIEKATGRKAERVLEPMQPGDVRETYADIEASARDLGFAPSVTLAEGVPQFVEWYRSHYGV
ncbi:MAG: SDR family NAD(P)-dependent oxidoreductase [Proteobacteria bacterium]|nr:SDR family NAD(P)-dependent oxidoreductase [Pseudomonadota bacterium]MDA1131636.1 SDR family NAD(P)-dependent oxidoreductase [Pseudomonadota bacterium]